MNSYEKTMAIVSRRLGQYALANLLGSPATDLLSGSFNPLYNTGLSIATETIAIAYNKIASEVEDELLEMSQNEYANHLLEYMSNWSERGLTNE